MSKHDMHLRSSKLDDRTLKQFCLRYAIGPEHKPTIPSPNHRITDCPNGYIGLYTKHFELSNLRIPFSVFFLNFLKEYGLNISQLSPMGAMRVTHFEIMCRAVGGEPSLPLFRQLFKLSRNGDWYSVRARSVLALSCLSWGYSPCFGEWKDSFFWVSADVIPFRMKWRQHNEPINVIQPHNERFDQEMYRLLVNHPLPLQRFPEHVLVMTGLSRNRQFVTAEPIPEVGDEGMGLLKYIEKKGLGAVRLTSRFPDEQGDEHVEIPVEEPATMPDSVHGSGNELCFNENVMETDSEMNVSASSSKQQNKSHEFSDRAENKRSTKRLRKNIVLSESSESSKEAGDQKSVEEDRVGSLAQLVAAVPELVTKFEKKAKREARLSSQVAHFRLRTSLQKAKIVKLLNKVRKLKSLRKASASKEKEAIRMIAKKTFEHANVVEALQKELQDVHVEFEEKLKQVHEEIEQEKEKVNKLKQVNKIESRKLEVAEEERKRLETELERVSSERKWLIEEGFEYVINRLHRSREYNQLLGAAQSHLWSSGAHYGVVAGYARCKEGGGLKGDTLYNPEAHVEFLKAVHELEHTRFPYVVALSRCADHTVDELRALEPIGFEEEEEDEVVGQ